MWFCSSYILEQLECNKILDRAKFRSFALLLCGHLQQCISHLDYDGCLTYLMTARSFDKASAYSFKMHPVSTTASVDPLMQGVLDSSSDALGEDPELPARTTYLHRLLSPLFPL
jgi:hypothetical protein